MDTNGQSRKGETLLRRVIVPAAYALALVVLCILFAGSYLIEIEDHYANMVFGGAYGGYDPYVPAINPFLGRMITGLYGLMPGINWFGVVLLGLLALSGATAMSLAARRKGGLIPGLVVLTPILVVLTASLQSQVVAGLCLAAGVLSLWDGCREGKSGLRRILLGAVLCAFSVMLSMESALFLAAALVIGAVLSSQQSGRGRALILCVVILVVSLGGPVVLAYSDSTWRTYHQQYAQYDQAHQSGLKDEVDTLLGIYGVKLSTDGSVSDDEDDHDHDEEEAHDEVSQSYEEAIAQSSFAQATGWSLNDADLFVRRSSVDAALVAPEDVALVNGKAEHFSFGRLLEDLLTTLNKMQFLMLLALLLLCALVLLLSTRRRGLTTLVAVAIALGGHVGMLVFYRSSFCDIAPFYLAGIVLLLYHVDYARMMLWFASLLKWPMLRRIAAGVFALGFLAVLGVLGYMMRRYNLDKSPSVEAAQDLYAAMEKLPDAVFIGDNPLDRYNPNALTVPTLGSDERLIAGSYDLYSPRMAAQMERFGLTNPLVDAVGREDVIYVDMSGSTLAVAINRLYEKYGMISMVDVPTASDGTALLEETSQHRMQLYRLIPLTEEELDALQAEYDEALAEAAHDPDENEEELDADALVQQALDEGLTEEDEAPEASSGPDA